MMLYLPNDLGEDNCKNTELSRYVIILCNFMWESDSLNMVYFFVAFEYAPIILLHLLVKREIYIYINCKRYKWMWEKKYVKLLFSGEGVPCTECSEYLR